MMQSNILVTDDLRCCICDFGLSIVIESQKLNVTMSKAPQGTTRWMAPELLDPKSFPECNSKTKIKEDIYAFGCTILEVS